MTIQSVRERLTDRISCLISMRGRILSDSFQSDLVRLYRIPTEKNRQQPHRIRTDFYGRYRIPMKADADPIGSTGRIESPG